MCGCVAAWTNAGPLAVLAAFFVFNVIGFDIRGVFFQSSKGGLILGTVQEDGSAILRGRVHGRELLAADARDF